VEPRTQVISYLVLGVLALFGGGFLVITQGGQLLDWLLVAGGAISIYLGIRDGLRMRREG